MMPACLQASPRSPLRARTRSWRLQARTTSAATARTATCGLAARMTASALACRCWRRGWVSTAHRTAESALVPPCQRPIAITASGHAWPGMPRTAYRRPSTPHLHYHTVKPTRLISPHAAAAAAAAQALATASRGARRLSCQRPATLSGSSSAAAPGIGQCTSASSLGGWLKPGQSKAHC